MVGALVLGLVWGLASCRPWLSFSKVCVFLQVYLAGFQWFTEPSNNLQPLLSICVLSVDVDEKEAMAQTK